MATIGIKGIRLNSVDFKREGDKDTITAEYSLMSTTDKVLAKQSIGGYGGMEMKPSADTIKALETFLSAYKRDIQSVLGLETE